MLLLWDELDDVVAACRHVTLATMDEVAEISGTLGAAIAAFTLSLLRLPS